MQWGDPPGGAPAPKPKIEKTWGPTSKLMIDYLESQYYFGDLERNLGAESQNDFGPPPGGGRNLERKDFIFDWFGWSQVIIFRLEPFNSNFSM